MDGLLFCGMYLEAVQKEKRKDQFFGSKHSCSCFIFNLLLTLIGRNRMGKSK